MRSDSRSMRIGLPRKFSVYRCNNNDCVAFNRTYVGRCGMLNPQTYNCPHCNILLDFAYELTDEQAEKYQHLHNNDIVRVE